MTPNWNKNKCLVGMTFIFWVRSAVRGIASFSLNPTHMHLRLYPSVINRPPPPPPLCARQSKTDINCNVYNDMPEKCKNGALCLQAGTEGSS